MQNATIRNLGDTSLRGGKRVGDPMQAFDALPGPLRGCLSQAALPWSPASAERVWNRARAKGLSVECSLQSFARAEAKTLAREKKPTLVQSHSPT